MKVYAYSQVRKKSSRLLNEAGQEGEVHIKHRNGQAFVIRLATSRTSPLDVEGVEVEIDLDELNKAVRESPRTYRSFPRTCHEASLKINQHACHLSYKRRVCQVGWRKTSSYTDEDIRSF